MKQKLKHHVTRRCHSGVAGASLLASENIQKVAKGVTSDAKERYGVGRSLQRSAGANPAGSRSTVSSSFFATTLRRHGQTRAWVKTKRPAGRVGRLLLPERNN